MLLYFCGSKYLFQINLVCIGDSRIGFCPGLLWKQELNLRSSHCSCSIKKGLLRNFVNFTGKLKSLFNRVEGQETQTQTFSCEGYEIRKNWYLRTTASGTCYFTWSVLKLAQIGTWFYNLQFRLPILPSLLILLILL